MSACTPPIPRSCALTVDGYLRVAKHLHVPLCPSIYVSLAVRIRLAAISSLVGASCRGHPCPLSCRGCTTALLRDHILAATTDRWWGHTETRPNAKLFPPKSIPIPREMAMFRNVPLDRGVNYNTKAQAVYLSSSGRRLSWGAPHTPWGSSHPADFLHPPIVEFYLYLQTPEGRLDGNEFLAFGCAKRAQKWAGKPKSGIKKNTLFSCNWQF